ncbi:MAG: alpha/beta fold hydrolase [Mucilaginibacter sp.]|uniref:alpha/beta fold hydrolase n=1 Tax=Mucilaginibacter sp. TaxID=1882438 RepID=UPI0031AC3F2D
MKTTIFFAHSAGAQHAKGMGSFDLVEHLRNTLGTNYEITFPIVSEPERPAYRHWRDMLDRELSNLPDPVILVGHSLGASVLLKYLSETQTNLQIRGMFLVAAPQWNKDGWNSSEWAVQKDFDTHLPPIPACYFYHCLNDPIVPFNHLAFYRRLFKTAIFRELSCQDHAFSNGLKELITDIRNIVDDQ